jgi:hypothetical protein
VNGPAGPRPGLPEGGGTGRGEEGRYRALPIPRTEDPSMNSAGSDTPFLQRRVNLSRNEVGPKGNSPRHEARRFVAPEKSGTPVNGRPLPADALAGLAIRDMASPMYQRLQLAAGFFRDSVLGPVTIAVSNRLPAMKRRPLAHASSPTRESLSPPDIRVKLRLGARTATAQRATPKPAHQPPLRRPNSSGHPLRGGVSDSAGFGERTLSFAELAVFDALLYIRVRRIN